MVGFVNNVRSFVNYAIFCELFDRMRFEVNCMCEIAPWRDIRRPVLGVKKFQVTPTKHGLGIS